MDRLAPGEVPLYVPAELARPASDRRGAAASDDPDDPDGRGAPPRWFRLAVAICPRHVRLRSALPEDLSEGPVEVRLHLPLDLDPPPPPLVVTGVAAETIVDEGEESERAELRLVLLSGTAEAARALIERYAASHAPGAPGSTGP
jgi:hypothetical protein